ncbi:unnamed protein product [Ambrosiozyma monospora]|uniref:Unnamed protein product n=1 Tax=Ambrosiozyma monospora TaxID=43982 RepID=A0ACB5SVK6_AMBMO|nr:unnamed protein product [Ambrosiozyma monospora]
MTKQQNTNTESKPPDTSSISQANDIEDLSSFSDTAVNVDDEKRLSISAIQTVHTHNRNSSTVSALSQQTRSKTLPSSSDEQIQNYSVDKILSSSASEPQTEKIDDNNIATRIFSNQTNYNDLNAPKTLTRKFHSELDRLFPEHFGKSPFIDAPFTTEPDDYELLGDIISETLQKGSKWLDSDMEDILHRSSEQYAISHQNSFDSRTSPHSIPIPIRNASNDTEHFHCKRARRRSATYDELRSARERSSYLEVSYLSLKLRLANISGVRTEKGVMVGNSFGFLGSHNKFRKWCYRTANSLLASCVMTLIIFFELGLLTYQMWFPETNGFIHLQRYSWVDYTMIGTNIVYGFFVILRIFAYGFVTERDIREFGVVDILNFFLVNDWFFAPSAQEIKRLKAEHRRQLESHECKAFLRSAGNITDLTGFISFIISTCLGLSGWELKTGILLFRSLMCLKLLRICNLTMGTRKIKRSIYRSLPRFIRLGFVIVCALFWFAIVGVQAYAEVFKKQCIFMDHDAGLYKFSNRVCGGYLDSDGKKHSPVVGSSYFIDHSFSTNGDYYSDILEHPDQINSTSLSVRGYICPVQSYCVFSNSPVAVNLSFDNFWKSLQLLFIFFCAGNYSDYLYNLVDSVSLPLACLFVVPAILILGVFMKNILVACILDTMSIYDEYTTDQDGARFIRNFKSYYDKRSIPAFLWDGFCCLIIFVSLVIQMIKQPTHSDCIIINSIVAVVLFFDILIRISIYKKDFFKRDFRINWVDTLLAIANIIILIPPISNKTEVYNWCTFFQIVRTYRIIMFVPFLRNMWIRLLGNLHFLGYLFTFGILLFYSTCVIYSRFFEGIVHDQDTLDSNLFTFSSLPNVILSLFTIMTTDNWTSGWSVAYSSSNRSSIRAFIFIYIALWFFVGAIMVINFFLDLITENLGVVSDAEKKWHQVVDFCLKATKRRSQGKEKLAIYDALANEEDPTQNFDLCKVSQMLYENENLVEYLKSDKMGMDYIEYLEIMANYVIKLVCPNALFEFLNIFYYNKLKMLKIDGTIITTPIYNSDNHDVRKKFLESHPLFDNSLFFITPNNPVRKFIQYIVPNFHGQRTSDIGKDMEAPKWRDTRAPFIFEQSLIYFTALSFQLSVVFILLLMVVFSPQLLFSWTNGVS